MRRCWLARLCRCGLCRCRSLFELAAVSAFGTCCRYRWKLDFESGFGCGWGIYDKIEQEGDPDGREEGGSRDLQSCCKLGFTGMKIGRTPTGEAGGIVVVAGELRARRIQGRMK